MFELYRNIFAPPRDLILVMAAIWLGVTLAEKRASNHKVGANNLNNLIFYPLLGFVLGGRILFAVANLTSFIESPRSIYSLNLNLFDPFGGFAVALVIALVYGQRQKMRFWPTLDALTPFFAIFTIGLALAHLASGSAFGQATTLPWGMELWGSNRHPSQIYEIIASLLTFGLLWFRKTNTPPGIHFLTFAALTSGWKLFLGAFRGDSTLYFEGLRSEQILAFLALATSLFLIEKKMKKLEEMVTRNNG